MLKILKYLTFITSIETLKEEFNWHGHFFTARTRLRTKQGMFKFN
jgi:hypothetical protein